MPTALAVRLVSSTHAKADALMNGTRGTYTWSPMLRLLMLQANKLSCSCAYGCSHVTAGGGSWIAV
jgi:hypothetical protein